MKIEPIAYFHAPFTSKFGIPRQSGIVGELKGSDLNQTQVMKTIAGGEA